MVFTLELYKNILAIVPSSELKKNTVYSVTIKSGLSGYLPSLDIYKTLSEDYQFWFTSEYCPLFTTVNRVKVQAGPLADTLTDDTIYRMIYKNSLDAVDLWNMQRLSNDSPIKWGCTFENVPAKLKRYVECKTAWDLLGILDQLSSSGSGDQLKSLGDMTIKYGAPKKGSDDANPNNKKNLYDCWNEMIRSFGSIHNAVRGYWDESKGYVHPVRAFTENRVVKPEIMLSEEDSTPGTEEWRRI